MRRNRQNRWDEFLHWIGYDKQRERYNDYMAYGFGILGGILAAGAFVGAAVSFGLIIRSMTFT